MLTLSALPFRIAVCRLALDPPVPAWASQGEFCCLLRTPGELTAVVREDAVPHGTTCEPGWRALKLEGPFDFALTGILSSVLQPLAEAKIGIFALSTFDTDYVLVKQELLDNAMDALRSAGHTFQECEGRSF
jgi:hypothetical protein